MTYSPGVTLILPSAQNLYQEVLTLMGHAFPVAGVVKHHFDGRSALLGEGVGVSWTVPRLLSWETSLSPEGAVCRYMGGMPQA